MLKLFNLRLLPLMCLALTVVIGTSCKKDDDNETKSEAVQLLSFGPTGARPGDTLRFFGNNLQKVTQIDFKGASVASTGFISQTAEPLRRA